MANMMKAIRFHGQRDVRLESVPRPKCGKGQVMIKPAFVGICGTDLHEYLGGANLCPVTPHALTGETVPLIMGHEFSGTVEEVGGDITDLTPGDGVSIQPLLYDGDCSCCKDGLINCCSKFGFIGLSGGGGGLSEHAVMSRKHVFKLPKSIPLDVAALIEPLAVGWHAVNLSELQRGATALVLGGGPIGLAVVQALRARGASIIIVSEVAAKRKQFARDFGAHHVLDPTAEDVVQRCRDLTSGEGVDLAFDAAGVQAALDQSIRAVKARGAMVNIAIWEREVKVYPNDWIWKERKWFTSSAYQDRDFEEIIEALDSGALTPQNMITMKIGMDQVVEKGFKGLIENKNDHVKILVKVSE